jgi:hypothetical protein
MGYRYVYKYVCMYIRVISMYINPMHTPIPYTYLHLYPICIHLYDTYTLLYTLYTLYSISCGASAAGSGPDSLIILKLSVIIVAGGACITAVMSLMWTTTGKHG